MASIGKLYYTPTSCGAASFISAHTAGLKFDSEQVDLQSHKTQSGNDFYQVNVHGNVPALVLSSGVVLNENASVLQYIADQAPASKLAPAAGTIERYQLINQLNWLGTELHKSFGPLFNPAYDATAKGVAKTVLEKKLDTINNELGSKSFVFGSGFTIADAYLYVILGWSGYLGIDLSKWANLKRFREATDALPNVKAANAAMQAAAPKK